MALFSNLTSFMFIMKKTEVQDPKAITIYKRYLNWSTWFGTVAKRMNESTRTVMLATDVKAFLLLLSWSLLELLKDKELTIDICEIYTLAQPTLKRAGRVR